jgi:hypothetical protein
MATGNWVKLHRKLLDSCVVSDDWLCRLWVVLLLRANWKPSWFAKRRIEPGQLAFSKVELAKELKVHRNTLSRALAELEKLGQLKSENVCNRFTIVTICKWHTYQNDECDDGATDAATAGQLVVQPQGNRVSTGGAYPKKGRSLRRKEGKNNTHTAAGAAECDLGASSNDSAGDASNDPQEPDSNGDASKTRPPTLAQHFDRFWQACPKKVGKREAEKAYHRAAKMIELRNTATDAQGGDPHGFLLERMQAYAASDIGTGDPQFIKSPSGWLNAGRYDDDPETWKRKESHNGHSRTTPGPGQTYDPRKPLGPV